MVHNLLLDGQHDGAPAVWPDSRPVAPGLPHPLQQPDLLHSAAHHYRELSENIHNSEQVRSDEDTSP